MSEFHIKTPVFEGPLELLLSLIEKRKVFISDISLADVADEYMAFVKQLDQFPIKDAAQFVLIASTLVLIKSKSLLPEFTLTQEEQADIHDLEERLRVYQRVQHLSKEIGLRFGTHILFPRAQTSLYREAVFAPHASITTTTLIDALHNVIARLPKKEVLKKVVVEKIMSLEEMMSHLSERITQALKMRFSDVRKSHVRGDATDREVRVNTIVSFLAMLELVKQGVLAVRQHQTFSDIEMETETVTTPSYAHL
ncbi:segregation/condensation protein A [Candidatus Campbellbacteria bacterium]|nr:MAG: segregation/condensation protein A [Candidatus Campbellbacteria bacterium]